MRKKWREVGSLVLCGAMMASMLAGCGNNASSSSSSSTTTAATTEATSKNDDASAAATDGDKQYDGVKLVYWSNWEATEPQGVVITEAVKNFENETGATVDLQFKGRKGIKEGLIPALDADQQVDMFDGAGNKSNYGDRIMCLEDLVKEHDYEKLTNPVLMELCRSYYSDGKLYEVPYQMKANGYMYNFGMHLARMIGSDEVKKVVNDGTWDRPEVLETAKAFEDLAAKGYFSAQVGSNVWPTGQNTELATGLAAMYCVGTFVANETKSITGPDFRWGFFGYPQVENGINGLEAMVIGSQSFGITSKCQNPEAAFALIEKLTRGEWDAKLAEESMSIPADTTNTSWPEQLADAKTYMDNCTEIFATSGGLENNPDITPALKENLMKLYAGTCTAEEFVSNMLAASK